MSTEIIRAEPTKELFVKMMIRDIPLDRAILDLIDNSIDGAHKLRNDENFDGLFTKLSIEKDKFIIEDNCGGISKDILLNQAFMFGKPIDYESTDHSIGRFGIGMKRAIFKIGNSFNLETLHTTSKSKMDIDIKEWLKDNKWEFKTNIENISTLEHNTKTIISITNLHPNISDEFKLEYFLTKLKNDLAFTYSLILNKNFKIFINGENIRKKEFEIINDSNLMPEIINFTFPIGETNEDELINIKIIAGVSKERDLKQGGWYIFCNDRLILEADKSNITGWDNNDLPKYHPDFAYFRGYVFFDSKDAELLPWTTTKTGLDSDSSVYKATSFEMKKALKKVISFLRERAKQESSFKKEKIDNNPLTKLIEEKSIEKNVIDIKNSSNQSFAYTAYTPKNINDLLTKGGITYSRSNEELAKLKDYLDLQTNKEIGEYTFDYFLELVNNNG
jgi:hypothetical protein